MARLSKASISTSLNAMEQFPIGFWNYTHIDSLDTSCAKDWADAGMTLAMSPYYPPDAAGVTKMRAILDAAAEQQIKVIVGDRRSYWRPGMDKGAAAYRKGFEQVVKALGDHPAIFSFHVGDEPDADQFEAATTAARIQKEVAPQLSPFLNLLPWHRGCEPRVGYESWARYLDDFVRLSKVDFLCYDCYSQMNPGDSGWDMYFTNLREYHEAAVRGGIPFWTTLLSVGHFRYRCPTEDDFRWQLSTAVAHGAQGILYFFFYMREPQDNYRVAPIDEHWERTEAFEWLSRINRSFLKGPAAVVKRLTLQDVRHVGTTYGGVAGFDGSGLVSRAESATPLIVSEFRDAKKRDYVMIVNNSQTESTQAAIWVRGERPRLHRVGWRAEEHEVSRGDGWTAMSGADFVTVRPWLAPGQMELYRVESAKP